MQTRRVCSLPSALWVLVTEQIQRVKGRRRHRGRRAVSQDPMSTRRRGGTPRGVRAQSLLLTLPAAPNKNLGTRPQFTVQPNRSY